MWKWLLAFMVLLVAIGLALYVVDVTGVVDIAGPVLTRIAAIPAVQVEVQRYRLGSERWEEWEELQADLIERELALERVRAELAEARRELRETEEALRLEREEIEQRIAVLEEMEAAREAALEQAAGLELLVDVYEAMRPAEVVAILADLEDETIIRLLSEMQVRNAAGILGLLDPERAARISRAISR